MQKSCLPANVKVVIKIGIKFCCIAFVSSDWSSLHYHALQINKQIQQTKKFSIRNIGADTRRAPNILDAFSFECHIHQKCNVKIKEKEEKNSTCTHLGGIIYTVYGCKSLWTIFLDYASLTAWIYGAATDIFHRDDHIFNRLRLIYKKILLHLLFCVKCPKFTSIFPTI